MSIYIQIFVFVTISASTLAMFFGINEPHERIFGLLIGLTATSLAWCFKLLQSKKEK